MNTYILYFFLVCVVVGISLFGVECVRLSKRNKMFSGTGFVEGPLMRKLVSLVMPKENTSEYLKLDDYVFVLDSKKTVRDLYVIKIICVFCSFLVAISITATNVYNRKSLAFSVNTSMPINITQDDYDLLIKGVNLNSNDTDLQAQIVKENIGTINNPTTVERLNTTSASDLLTYLQVINKRLNSVFSIIDILIFIGIVVFGWFITNFMLNWLVGIIMGRELFEYDDLETDILMLSDQQVFIILETLKKNSMFYREFFCKFRELYIESSQKAYELVASRREFPEHFKKLIRYLNMIETDGPEYVKLVISSNKETTNEDIFRALWRQDKNRVRTLNILVGISFFSGLIRIVLSLIMSAPH